MRLFYTRLVLFATSAFAYVAPLLSEPSRHNVTSTSVGRWVKAVNAQLDAAIVEPAGGSGYAVVTFRRNVDGRAAVIQISATSEPLRRATADTMQRLHRLPPMPPGIDPQQPIRAQLLFADEDSGSYQQNRNRMLVGARAMNQRFAKDIAPAAVELAATG
jgi:hypothetical protein